MDHAVQRAADPVHPKAALLQAARSLPEQDLKRFREPTDEALRIKPDDLWKVVAGKAISRCAIDPTAERFSRTAQFFSRALAQFHGDYSFRQAPHLPLSQCLSGNDLPFECVFQQ
jgi:hypothetical protein